MKGFSIGAVIGFTAVFGIFYFIGMKGEAGQHVFEVPETEQATEVTAQEEKSFTAHKEPSVQESVSDLEGTAKWGDHKKRNPSSEEMKVNLRKAKETPQEKKSDILVEMKQPKLMGGKGHVVEATKPLPMAAEKYSVQIASNPDKRQAESMLEKLKAEGFAGFIQPATVNEKQYYRVRLGPVNNKDEAHALLERAEKIKGVHGPIIAKD